MGLQPVDLNELKRRARKLKRLENIIRFQGAAQAGRPLVWDRFFDLRDVPAGRARYTLPMLAAMSRAEYRSVIDAYFVHVYFEFYKENGITAAGTYDPAILAELDLPFNADENDVKRKFRELAKRYHPDTGGDEAKFIDLMKVYEKLSGFGKQ